MGIDKINNTYYLYNKKDMIHLPDKIKINNTYYLYNKKDMIHLLVITYEKNKNFKLTGSFDECVKEATKWYTDHINGIDKIEILINLE